MREGSLDAPTRHPVDWQNDDFYNKDSIDAELERVFDICHGCRRCVSLCNAFPTLFDLVDESDTLEVDGVDKADYAKVVDQCYLCDLCYMTKCPYVPPHPWNVDFPHLMLRAKAHKFKEGKTRWRDRFLSSTDAVGKAATFIPVVDVTVNAIMPAPASCCRRNWVFIPTPPCPSTTTTPPGAAPKSCCTPARRPTRQKPLQPPPARWPCLPPAMATTTSPRWWRI